MIESLTKLFEEHKDGSFEILSVSKGTEIVINNACLKIKYITDNNIVYIKNIANDTLICSFNLDYCIGMETNINPKYIEKYIIFTPDRNRLEKFLFKVFKMQDNDTNIRIRCYV